MVLVGVTGQTGSGKSTFSEVFQEIGAKLIDVDKIGHDLLNEPHVKEKVINVFSQQILDENGMILRERLGELVFSDTKNRFKLDDIMEEPIIHALESKIIEIRDDGFPGIVVVDAALLPRWKRMIKFFNYIVLVESPRWQRINRLIENRGLSQTAAEKRIDVLENLYDDFTPNIHYHIKNSGNLAEFRAKVVKVWLDLKNQEKNKK